MVGHRGNNTTSESSASYTKPTSSLSAGILRLSLLARPSTRKRTSSFSPNDPFMFHEDGVEFKGKLVGETEVKEPRNEEICWDALKLLKAVIKAAGAHKQRIILNVSVNGIKIRDERSSFIVYNFPVSKISFVSRDFNDHRAFGFVVENHGKFMYYGIKTAQTSDQIVTTIHDMFQTVLEMKNRQNEVSVDEESSKEHEDKDVSLGESALRFDNGLIMEKLVVLDLEPEEKEPELVHSMNFPSSIPSYPYQPIPDPFDTLGFRPSLHPSQQQFFDTVGDNFRPGNASTPRLFPPPSSFVYPQHVPFQSPKPYSNTRLNASFDFFNHSYVNSSQPKIGEPKRNIDDFIKELANTNLFMETTPDQNQAPFEHIQNPSRPSIAAVTSQPKYSTNDGSKFIHVSPPKIQVAPPPTPSDPFNDSFFNNLV